MATRHLPNSVWETDSGFFCVTLYSVIIKYTFLFNSKMRDGTGGSQWFTLFPDYTKHPKVKLEEYSKIKLKGEVTDI